MKKEREPAKKKKKKKKKGVPRRAGGEFPTRLAGFRGRRPTPSQTRTIPEKQKEKKKGKKKKVARCKEEPVADRLNRNGLCRDRGVKSRLGAAGGVGWWRRGRRNRRMQRCAVRSNSLAAPKRPRRPKSNKIEGEKEKNKIKVGRDGSRRKRGPEIGSSALGCTAKKTED